MPRTLATAVSAVSDALPHERELRPVFQAIVNLRDASLTGYEGLIRGPHGSRYEAPLVLMQAARAQGQLAELELACCRQQIKAFSDMKLPGRLLLNLGSAVLLEVFAKRRDALHFLLNCGLAPERLVIEITEHETVDHPAALALAMRQLRESGMRFALDDFGDGRSSLRLWAELQPDIVKVDRYFIHEIDREPAKFAVVKTLTRLAETFGTELVAEGIETEAELAVVRDLGIQYGQGFLFGMPSARPATELSRGNALALNDPRIAVYPTIVRTPMRQATLGPLARRVAPASPAMSVDEVARRFKDEAELVLMPVVAEGRPLGLIDRHRFMDRYAQPYQRELFGRKPCTLFMNPRPEQFEQSATIDEITKALSSGQPRILAEGFIVTDQDGGYFGVGTGEALFVAISELRVEAARHANPLTFLPGNIPISEHVARLLTSGAGFAACYADLDHFKPFNDRYGYKRGDEMIKLAAQIIVQEVDERRDFVGHVGGDDFVILFQSGNWQHRCERIVERFNCEALSLIDIEDLEAGGLLGRDRRSGESFLAPYTTISIGGVRAHPGRYSSHEEVASAATEAKSLAKRRRAGFSIVGEESGRHIPGDGFAPLRQPAVIS